MLDLHTRQVYTVDATAIKRARKNEKEQLRGDKAEVPPWDGLLLIKEWTLLIYRAFSETKGMDFIDLPSIFRDLLVQSSIPNYFKNCEVPIICYQYNKPIRGAVFNFNKLVSDLDIETCTPDS